MDATPTQGLDKITGTCKKGADVQKVEFNIAMAEASNPLLNETPDQKSQRHKRSKLLENDKVECSPCLEELSAQKTQKIAL